MLLKTKPNGHEVANANRPVVEFSSGRFSNARLNNPQVWAEAVEIAVDLLQQLGYFGSFSLKAFRKVRWAGHPTVRFKVSRHEREAVLITIRPEGFGNDNVYEYQLAGRFKDWNAEEAFYKIKRLSQDATEVATREEPVAVSTSSVNASAKPKLDLAARISQLQATARRNDKRRQAIEEIHGEQAKIREQLNALEAALNGLEENELQLLDEIEQDRECVEASQALETLEKLLG